MDKMESNPCYGCSNLVYEEINQSVNTSKDEGLERKVAEKNVIDYNQPKMTTSSNKKIVIAIAVCVSLLALSVVAVAALAIVSYKEITTLQSRVQLQGSPLTNTDQESLTQINEQLDSLQNVVNVLNAAVHNITTDVNSLQSAVDTLNTTTMIQFSGDTHLYENCIQENRSCQISQISSGTYSKACNTASLLINSTVSVHILQDLYRIFVWGVGVVPVRLQKKANTVHIITFSTIV